MGELCVFGKIAYLHSHSKRRYAACFSLRKNGYIATLKNCEYGKYPLPSRARLNARVIHNIIDSRMLASFHFVSRSTELETIQFVFIEERGRLVAGVLAQKRF
jgi:hypothetical protein